MLTQRPLTIGITLLYAIYTQASWADNRLPVVIVQEQASGLTGDGLSSDQLKLSSQQEGGAVLRQILGVDAARMGGHGLDPTIHGQSQTQLNVILDDAYLHGGCPNRMDPPTSFASIESYDHVQVIQGVGSLQYGSGGSGGTILFERALPAMGTHGKFEIGAGNNAYKSSANAEISTRSQSGYLRAFSINKDGSNYTDGNGNKVNASYRSEHHGIVAGVTPSAQDRIEFSAEKIITHDALFQGSGMDAPNDEMNIMRLKYHGQRPIAFIDAIKANIAYAADDHLMDNYSLRPAGMMLMASPTTSNTLSGALALTSHLSKSTQLDYGLNLQHVDRNAQLNNVKNQMTMSYNWPGAVTNRLGLFAEALHALNHQSRLTLGMRADSISAEATKLNDKPNPMAISAAQMYQRVYGYQGDGKINENNWGALARYEYDLTPQLSWFIGISHSMRTADETERFFANGNSIGGSYGNATGSGWVGNPYLLPEKHRQLDTGLNHQTDQYSWRASIFYDNVNDYILRDKYVNNAGVRNANITTYRNIDATLYGVQLEGSLKIMPTTQLSAGLSYVHSHNDSDGRYIAQTPPLSGYLAVNKQIADYTLGARWRFQDKQDNIDLLSGLDTQKTPAWSVLDIYATYRVTSMVNLMAGIDNVFDHAYYQHIGRADSLTGNTITLYEPGRAAWVKLSARF